MRATTFQSKRPYYVVPKINKPRHSSFSKVCSPLNKYVSQRRTFLNVSPRKCSSDKDHNVCSAEKKCLQYNCASKLNSSSDFGTNIQRKFISKDRRFKMRSSSTHTSVKRTELEFTKKKQIEECHPLKSSNVSFKAVQSGVDSESSNLSNDSDPTSISKLQNPGSNKNKTNAKNTIGDEDIIILSDEDHKPTFSVLDIKRCIKNMVDNLMMGETSINDLDAFKIAQRMQILYHQDFTSRLKEIEDCLIQAKRNCAGNSSLMKEIRPGIRKIDLETLNKGQWLNDIVVNKYISLLCSSKPWACCVSSFFYNMLERRGKHSLPEEWFEKKYFLIPMCVEHHWSLLCALPSDQCIEIYNSMSTTDYERECALTIKDYLEAEYNQEQCESTVWKVVIPGNVARQQNEYDCGVYVCMFARQILYDLSSDIEPSNVTSFRCWLRKELLSNRIES